MNGKNKGDSEADFEVRGVGLYADVNEMLREGTALLLVVPDTFFPMKWVAGPLISYIVVADEKVEDEEDLAGDR